MNTKFIYQENTMKSSLWRYGFYIITVGFMYGLFRISDFNQVQSKTLAVVAVALGAGIMEIYTKKKS